MRKQMSIMSEDSTLTGFSAQFLDARVAEAQAIIRKTAEISEFPLLVQFSGGRDSMAMLGLARSVTDHFICCYMESGLEFPGTLDFVRNACNAQGVPLLVSHPSMHKGTLFDRLPTRKHFPNVRAQWCNPDLKLRPQKKLLHRIFGRGTFYKLCGVRRFESTRRAAIYKRFAETLMRPDAEHPGSYQVFPILNWTDADILNYIARENLPTHGGYKMYGVSGCSWCIFYGADIYLRVLEHDPNFYDKIIAWENTLGEPSIIGKQYMRDLKDKILKQKEGN